MTTFTLSDIRGFVATAFEGSGLNAAQLDAIADTIMPTSQGAQILRVHDVAETKQALTVSQAFAHIDNNP